MHIFRLQSGVRVRAEHAQPMALRTPDEALDRADLNTEPKRLEFRPGATGLGDVLKLDVQRSCPEPASQERNANFHVTRNPTNLFMEEL